MPEQLDVCRLCEIGGLVMDLRDHGSDSRFLKFFDDDTYGAPCYRAIRVNRGVVAGPSTLGQVRVTEISKGTYNCPLGLGEGHEFTLMQLLANLNNPSLWGLEPAT